MKIHKIKAETIGGSDADARTTLIGSNSKTLMRENDFWNSFLKQKKKKQWVTVVETGERRGRERQTDIILDPRENNKSFRILLLFFSLDKIICTSFLR